MSDRHAEPERGPAVESRPSLFELAAVYLKISLLGFGGPNAHLALMLDEVVDRRGWLSKERFLELIAVTHLLPGPNSSEVAIHVGYTQRGWPGALVTGLTFLAPTFVMVTALAALYFEYGALPQVEALFWGLQPVIVAIVLSAGIKIGRAGVKTPTQGLLAVVGALVSLVSGPGVILVMALGGALTWWRDRPGRPTAPGLVGLLLPLPVGVLGLGTLGGVFWTHLWMGSVLFGGGYVLVALLEPYAVGQYGWLTAAQFLDGVALTQAVPGPISTLSAFVGYAAAGVPGAVLGTVGIYLPAFVAVLYSAPRLERVREMPAVQAALKGVVAVAAGAVFGVGVSLVGAGVSDVTTGALAVVALVAITWKKTPALWLMGLGLAAGMLRSVLT